MFIAIVFEPGCDIIDFEINLIFKWLFTVPFDTVLGNSNEKNYGKIQKC